MERDAEALDVDVPVSAPAPAVAEGETVPVADVDPERAEATVPALSAQVAPSSPSERSSQARPLAAAAMAAPVLTLPAAIRRTGECVDPACSEC